MSQNHVSVSYHVLSHPECRVDPPYNGSVAVGLGGLPSGLVVFVNNPAAARQIAEAFYRAAFLLEPKPVEAQVEAPIAVKP